MCVEDLRLVKPGYDREPINCGLLFLREPLVSTFEVGFQPPVEYQMPRGAYLVVGGFNVPSSFKSMLSRSTLAKVDLTAPQISTHILKARARSKVIHSRLHVGEQKEGLAITVRFFQTSKRPVSFTQQTIKYRHLCRSALITALQLFQISQHAPRRFCLFGHSISLGQSPEAVTCVAEDFDKFPGQRDALFETSFKSSYH